MRILLAEDDQRLAEPLSDFLTREHHAVTWVSDGRVALRALSETDFDLALIDWMLPGLDGLAIVKDLRRQQRSTLLLMLTARDNEEDVVAGLQAGADDYLVKPFAFPELMARIEAVCRRSGMRPAPTVQAGDLSLDLATRRVVRGGHEIDLTPTEFSLLEFLIRHAGQLVTRKMLCEHLWESDWEGATNVIEVHINRLRGKLDKGFDRSLIQTIRGRGYALRAS